MTTPNQPYPPPARRSVWTLQQKAIRLVWSTAGRMVWVCAPALRPWLIRRFGGRVGPGCRFARSVDIIIPWNLHVGRNVQIGRDVTLYTLGVVTIGDGVVIDDFAHLCAGTHDFTDSRFPLLKPPITIGPDTFIGMDAYVAPDVTLGAGCRVWPRASVYRSFGDGTNLQGNPARPVPAPQEPGA